MRTLAFVALLVVSCLILNAGSQDSKPTIKMVPPSPTSAASGPEMFNTYCAVCHGVSGKGDGPAAASLKHAPPDLTQIARKNGGKFPEIRVFLSITEDVNGAHGSSEMPVWGPVFRSLQLGDSLWRLRVENLTEYIRTLQAK
jgi:mono/diheme cytochrome c family protein